jgi:SNF family Na+-dependent transporter
LTLPPNPAQTDQSVVSGLSFMWEPEIEALKNEKTWLAAAGQIFFSLSVGFGVIINYASYMRRKDDVVLSGLTASATNEFFEVVLGGLITIPAAVVFLGAGLVETASSSSFTLGFNTLPVVFAHMPLGGFFGGVFFLMLFLAAVTSSLSMLFPTMAFVEESLGVDRRTSTIAVVATSLLGSAFVLYYSNGLTALSTIDFWVGTVLIFILATVQIICFGWIWGIDKGMEEARQGARMQIPGVFRFIIKYVTPLYLIAVFVMFCLNSLPAQFDTIAASRVTQYTLGMIALITVILCVMLSIGVKRWRALGLDIDGALPAPEEDEV